MKAEDLRIGNYVYLDGFHDELYEITDGSYVNNVEHFVPIPLTPEWLERAGFEAKHYIENVDEWTLPTNYLFKIQSAVFNDGTIFGLGNSHNSLLEKIDLKYVHQLQNLYHALTQTELTFKQ